MNNPQVLDPVFPGCPIRNVLSRICGQWPMLVLLTLHGSSAPMRFRDLCKAIPDLSQKMLSATLHELVADDLVARSAYAEIPPRVEYTLTERGLSLMPLIDQLVGWSLSNMKEIIESRERYIVKNK